MGVIGRVYQKAKTFVKSIGPAIQYGQPVYNPVGSYKAPDTSYTINVKDTGSTSPIKTGTGIVGSGTSGTSVGDVSGGSRSSGGGGGGVSVGVTPASQVKTTTPATFTGKFETIGEGETKYYKEGKEVGKLFSVKGEKYAEVSKGVKSAFFQFDTLGGTKRQEVELGGETGGARISEYEMMIGGGDIRQPTQGEVLGTGGGLFLLPGEASSLGITTSLVEGGTKGAGQRQIEYTESLFGMAPGTSGMVFLGSKDIAGTKGFTSKDFLGETPLRDVGLGALKFGTRLGLTGADILATGGMQTFQEGEKPRLFSIPFGKTEAGLKERFSGFESFMEKPTAPIGRATELGLGIGLITIGGWQGAKQFKLLKGELGTGGAIAESFGLVTPLRPKAGIYTTTITEETPFKFASFLKETEGIQVRGIVGKGQGFEVYSQQISKVLPSGKVSTGIVDTKVLQEATQIGGGKIQTGVIYSKAEGFQFSPLREGGISQVGISRKGLEIDFGKVFFEDYKVGISTSATRQKYSLFFKETKTGLEGVGEGFNTRMFKVSRGAGVSKDINEVISRLSFGKRTSIPTQRIEGGVVIREPSGIYRFKPTATGYEINLNKLLELQKPSEFGITKIGGKKTPFADTFGDMKQLQTQVKIQKPMSKSFTKQMESIQSSLGSVQKPELPYMVGGTGLKFLPYTGTGRSYFPDYSGTYSPLYSDVGEFGGFKKPSITGGVIKEYGKREVPSRVFDFGRIKPMEMEVSKTLVSQFQPLMLVQKPRQLPIQAEIPREMYGQREIQLLGTKQVLRQLQVPKQITTPFRTFEWGWGTGWGVPPFLIPPLLLPEGKRREKTFERGFKFSPTFGTVLGKGLGIEFETFKFGGMTGILERPFKKGIKLPTVI